MIEQFDFWQEVDSTMSFSGGMNTRNENCRNIGGACEGNISSDSKRNF